MVSGDINQVEENMSTTNTNIKPISSILVANRGEIASRIFRTCRKMGIRSIAVYTDADQHMPYVNDADEAIYIGASAAHLSYLDHEVIIQAAHKMETDAIHPGYGFLSENANFAQKCIDQDLIWIGPHPQAIAAMGSKSHARVIMQDHDIPVVPGYNDDNQQIENLIDAAQSIGYPILLKATAGGGGKGMKVVHKSEDIEKHIRTVKREALNLFGDDRLIIEKYITDARHIEVQVIGDQHGHLIHLFERDCTIQRRHQKVIEETPSPALSHASRNKVLSLALKAVRLITYDNAGTVEFLYDVPTDSFYFLEVNTRLQVEHPVTEAVTDIDLVQLQIESAQGIPLSISQEDIKTQGHAIEVRLYAEDPTQEFIPSSGQILQFSYPSIDGLRMESSVQSGAHISIYYDPMIAKIIVHSSTRPEALRKILYVLKNMTCAGIKTNQHFLIQIIENKIFRSGKFNTQFIDQHLNLLDLHQDPLYNTHYAAMAATVLSWYNRRHAQTLLRGLPSGWRNNDYQPQHNTFENDHRQLKVQYRYIKDVFTFTIDEASYQVQLVSINDRHLLLSIDGCRYKFAVIEREDKYFVHNSNCGHLELSLIDRLPSKKVDMQKGAYLSPMPAQIIDVLVHTGQEIRQGQELLVISSMKMESTIEANDNGVVADIFVAKGDNIEAGIELLRIDSKSNQKKL